MFKTFHSYVFLTKVSSLFCWITKNAHHEKKKDSLQCPYLLNLPLHCFPFFFFFFFKCGPLLKSLLNLLQYCFCFMFWFFGCEACGILAPRPGIEPAPPALEGEVLTTGPPGKSRLLSILNRKNTWSCIELQPHLLGSNSQRDCWLESQVVPEAETKMGRQGCW